MSLEIGYENHKNIKLIILRADFQFEKEKPTRID